MGRSSIYIFLLHENVANSISTFLLFTHLSVIICYAAEINSINLCMSSSSVCQVDLRYSVVYKKQY